MPSTPASKLIAAGKREAAREHAALLRQAAAELASNAVARAALLGCAARILTGAGIEIDGNGRPVEP